MFLEFRKRFRRRIRRRTSAADQFDLPEPAIQLIQSFLTSKQAARTTLLSKSWRSAWLTRPNLDFHLPTVKSKITYGSEVSPELLAFAEKTLERYENFNLKIDSFRLRMKQPSLKATVTVTKLVRRALKLEPTHLTFEFEGHGYDFEIQHEVFTHENLVSLTAKRCTINLLNPDGVCCSKLQFLSLEHVTIECRDIILFGTLMKSCPLIEKLSLCHVKYDVYDDVYDVDSRLETNFNLQSLTSLVLKEMNFDTRLLANLSLIFPSIKDLNLHLNEDREEILISSPTLERLDFIMADEYKVHRVKLDVPSIRKLTLFFNSIPKLSVTSNSRGWESDVYITRRKRLSNSWFYKLSHFLKKLKFSKISLTLQVDSQAIFDYDGEDIRGNLPMPEIENLTIDDSRIMSTLCCYAFFDGLFRICRPKVIDIEYESHGTKVIRFLGKRLLEARDAKVPFPNYQFMYGLNDLMEVRAQVFDEDLDEWRDVTLESLLDEYSTDDDAEGYDFRFLLNWKQ